MFAYFKQCEYPNVRNKLFIIYALNINDIQLTWFLLKTGMFIEVNPVMDFFIATTYLAVITKVVLPAALLFYVGFRLRSANESQLRVSNIVINVIFIIYTLINIMHLFWIALYFIVL
jgi:hypothetical protein